MSSCWLYIYIDKELIIVCDEERCNGGKCEGPDGFWLETLIY